MKAEILFTAGGPLAILTSYEAPTDPALLQRLHAKGIDKFVAYEVPVEVVRQRYGQHFAAVAGDIRQDDELRVLDEDGQRIFNLFRFDELGPPVAVEAKTARV